MAARDFVEFARDKIRLKLHVVLDFAEHFAVALIHQQHQYSDQNKNSSLNQLVIQKGEWSFVIVLRGG